jgi:hypothetical protein
VRTYLVFTLPVARFLVISPPVFYGYMGLMIAWSGLYMRRWRKRHGPGLQQPGAAAQQETEPVAADAEGESCRACPAA